jgi:hypothetical protein
LWAWSEGIGGAPGDCKGVLACPALTLTLSPLRGEGTAHRRARTIGVLFAPSSRLGVRFEEVTSATRAKTHIELSVDARCVPSPLNGEKVAGGRMRGGNARGFDSREITHKRSLALPPLTLTLSPLRGEGTRSARQARVSSASSSRRNTAIASPHSLRSHSVTNF